jgi:hypothetical protein
LTKIITSDSICPQQAKEGDNMNKNDRMLYIVYFALFMFLLLWIYPSEANFNKVSVKKQLPDLVLVGYEEQKELVTKTKQVIEYQTEVKYETLNNKKIIGQKEVGTGNYKRIQYTGRYVYNEVKTTNGNIEYKYIDSYTYNHCEESCSIRKMYVYDQYSIEETKQLVNIYIDELVINEVETVKEVIKEYMVEEEVIRQKPIYSIEEKQPKNNFKPLLLFNI